MTMNAIILAGGSGTRLWPASTSQTPKQFIDLDSNGPLLAQTLERCIALGIKDHCYVITRDCYESQVGGTLAPYYAEVDRHIILEPVARNTAPAILLAAKYLEYEAAAALDDVMIILPSDHLIPNNDQLIKAFQLGERLAQEGNIVIFGISPDKPETGYGYIKAEPDAISLDSTELEVYPVQAFKEKPVLAVAEQYLAEGGYFWNAGMFGLTLRTLYQELDTLLPEFAPFLDLSYQEMRAKFAVLPQISFDYAVMEKTSRAVVIPLSIQWSDVGSWDSVYEIMPKDEHGNVIQGNVLATETYNSLVINQTSQALAIANLQDMIAIQTANGLLMSRLGNAQKVGQIAHQLQQHQFSPTVPSLVTV